VEDQRILDRRPLAVFFQKIVEGLDRKCILISDVFGGEKPMIRLGSALNAARSHPSRASQFRSIYVSGFRKPFAAQIRSVRDFWSTPKRMDKDGGNDFVHTNHAWDVQVLGPPPLVMT
jgi:hypothetical protein